VCVCAEPWASRTRCVGRQLLRPDGRRSGCTVGGVSPAAAWGAFTTPLRKSDYLFGRLLGGTITALLLLAAVPLGMMIGSFMPWLDPQRVGPFGPGHYLYALFVFGLPSVLACGGIYFALATVTRSLMWAYLGVVAYFLLHLAATIALSDPAYDRITALMDPFGGMAFNLVTRYWTAAECNTMLARGRRACVGARLLAISPPGARRQPQEQPRWERRRGSRAPTAAPHTDHDGRPCLVCLLGAHPP
jgi:hypothetical protein